MTHREKTVFWAIIAKDAEKTLPLYLECLYRQEYERHLITLYFRTNDNRDCTETLIRDFIEKYGHEYRKVVIDASSVDPLLKKFDNHEWNSFRFSILGAIRNESIRIAAAENCDFYFVSDVDNFIVPQTLRALVDLNLEIVAPLLQNARSEQARQEGLGSGDAYSNFHCDMNEFGAYKNSQNYLPLLNRDFIGIHQVPLVHCTYLIRRDVLSKVDYVLNPTNYEYRNFSISANNNGVKQFLDNRLVYGVLTLLEDTETARAELPRLEWYATKAKSIVYKVFNCGEYAERNQNAQQIRSRLDKFFPQLFSETVFLKEISDLEKFIEMNPDFLIKENLDYPGWRLGAIGIWASWFKAIKTFMRSRSDSILLLEDDLWLADIFFQTFAKAISELPDDWDFLTFYSPENQWNRFESKSDQDRGFITKPYATWSCAAVIISRRGAEKILRYIASGIQQHVDLWLFTNQSHKLKGFALTPAAQLENISVYLNWESTIGLPTSEFVNIK